LALNVSVQIQSIQRAAAVLRLLTGDSRPRALAELAAELQLPKGTVYGILRTLQTVGFVEQDTESRRYQLGAALLHIGSSYLNGNELRRRALGCAHALATRTGESVRIGTLHESRVLIVHHVIGPHEQFPTPELGSLLPLHASALGKVLLAHHPHLAAELGRGPLTAYTSGTLTDPDRLATDLADVSQRGWADDIAECRPGIASTAAPVKERGGTVAGAIAVSGPIRRLCLEGQPQAALVEYVLESARAISRELGGDPW
jgi:DNA-binding IclR family transcriptional regulator